MAVTAKLKPLFTRLSMLAGGGLMLAALAAVGYLSSASFQNMVRRNIVEGVNQSTGGKLELGSLHFSPWRLSFDATDVVFHGREPEGATPLVHADAVHGSLRLLTLLGDPKAGLESLTVERPEVHISVLADGSSNLPVPPPSPAESLHQQVRQLFNIVLGDVALNHGELHWNDRTVPLQMRAHHVEAGLARSLASRTFTGRIGADIEEAREGNLDDSDSEGKTRKAPRKPPTRPLIEGRTEIQFTIAESAVTLNSFTMNTARSKVTASGAVKNLEDPAFEGGYEATVSLAELGVGANRPKLAGGDIALRGDLKLSAKEQTSAGTAALRGLDWRGDDANFNRVLALANYKFDGERILLAQVRAEAHGGTASGTGEILLVPNPARKADRGRPAGSGVFHLQVEHLPLVDVLDAVKDGDTVAGRHLNGLISGPVDVDWLDADHGDIRLDVTVQPPAGLAEGTLGLAGSAKGTVRLNGTLLVERLDASYGANTGHAEGQFGEQGSLNLKLHLGDLAELRPVLADLGWERGAARANAKPLETQPESLGGEMDFQGAVSGTGHEPTIAGHVDARHLVVRWPANGSERVARFDSAHADLDFRVSQLALKNAELRMGAQVIRAEAQIPLIRGDLDHEGPVTLHAAVDHARIEELGRISGHELPISGNLQGKLTVGGSMADPRGDGDLVLTDAVAEGVPVARASARLLIGHEEAEFHNLAVATLHGTVTGDAAVQLQTGALRYDLRGAALKLGELEAVSNLPMQPAATLDFTAQGSGAAETPVLTATAHLTAIELNHRPVGDFTATVMPDSSTRQLRWLVHGDSNFAGPQLSVQGTIVPGGDWQSQLEARFSGMDIDPVLRNVVQRGMTGHSSVGGMVTVSGPLRRPGDLEARGRLEQFVAEVRNVKLQSDGPMTFHMAGGQLQLDRVRLTGEGSNFSAGGTVAMRGERKMDVTADGQVNLHLIEAFYPELLTNGVIHTNMHVTGTLAEPRVEGRVLIDDASLSYADLPSGLNHIKGSLRFNQDRLQVESLTAQTGAGDLSLGGEIAYRNGLDFRLTATGKDVRLRYPPGLSATGDAELQMNGTPDNATLSGRVQITKLGVSPRFDLGAYLSKAKQTSTAPNTPITGLKLNVRLTTVPELDFETGLGKLSGDADLRILGTAGHPVVLGRINVVQGEVEIAGSTYRLEHGEIAFNNPVRIEPVVDLGATARVRDYDITMGLHGTPDKLTVNYRSDPPLPTSDIIALLALGRTRQDTGIVSSRPLSLDASTTNAILEEARNATASSRVQRLFGGARIKIDPQAGGVEGSTGGARLTIEQQISNKLTLTYITNVSQTQQQVIQVEYNLPRNVSIVGIRDSNSVVGFDVRVRARRR